MLQRLLLLPFALLFSLEADAQFRYVFKDTTTPYVALAGATSLNAGLIWGDENLVAPMPFTWKLDSAYSLSRFNLALSVPGVCADTTSFSNYNGFFFGDIDIADRGTLMGTASLSPIRYLTTGTSPNRIFKLELANAGFQAEYDNYSTMDDSISLQIWIYETKNIVEFHYGPSRITNPTDYFGFFGNPGPFSGYASRVDFMTGNAGTFYYLKGNPTAPSLDTFKWPATAFYGYLNSWPASGRVYRFTPKSSCTLPVASFTAGTPSGKTVLYTYGGTTVLDSLVWNFGDGQKQKVTTGFTTPVSHTFASGGSYTVTATAYNSCGSHVATRLSVLSAYDLSALGGNVKVFPNPVRNNLIIEGMHAGDQAELFSVTGQKLMSRTISSDRQAIDMSQLPDGVYMLKLSRRNGASATVPVIRR